VILVEIPGAQGEAGVELERATTDDEAERRVALRIARQRILTRPDPPRLWLIIDETALRRPAATTGPAIMRGQLAATNVTWRPRSTGD
jgi:hypothetical protein